MTATIINTALGDVETEVQGSGIPVLILHGSPGGIDAARTMSRFLPLDHFQTICISRPGYLGTPLDPNNKSLDHETDLLAALLDKLGIQRVGVVAWSGGGPPAYRFAVRHPTRVASIIAIACVSGHIVIPPFDLRQKFFFQTRLGERMIASLAKHKPEHLVEEALASEGSISKEAVRNLTKQVMADPEQSRVVLEVSQVMNVSGKRKAGYANDEANFAATVSLELERVQCPVLLVHGDSDTDVLPQFSIDAHAALPLSTLVMLKDGTHFSLYAHPDGAQAQEQARKWLSDHR